MKIMHLSDLHLGKNIFEHSLIENQKYILEQILEIARKNNVKAVLMAGDIYDKTVPNLEAVNLLNDFLTKLQKENLNVFIISGNHDSKERLSFGNKILENNQIFIHTNYDGILKLVKLEDVNIYMLPFIKPAYVRSYFGEDLSYNDAVKKVIENENINTNEKNIILVHQFVTSSSSEVIKSDSESISLGGIDNVDIENFKDFNYVAMGHIHRPQRLTRDTARYAGSILKYSFSEANYNKSVPIIDTDTFAVTLEPLTPLRDMVILEGTLEQLLKDSSDDYVNVILTDEDELIDPINELRKKYPNVLKLDFKNKRSYFNEDSKSSASGDVKNRTPLDLFEEFYLNQNNVSLNDELREIFINALKEVNDETN